MSLLRQRATDVSVESTLSVRRPALARARLVKATSCDSAVESNAPLSQARLRAGVARVAMEVSPNRSAVASARRVVGRGLRVAPSDIRSGTSEATGVGSGAVDTVGRQALSVRPAMVRVARGSVVPVGLGD